MGGLAAEHRRLRAGNFLLGIALFAAALIVHVPIASAVITEPAVIDGPSSDGIVLGGVAMAPDGTGGLVYTKTVEGKPHIFASRYTGSTWTAPIRVDTENPFEAGEPRIAAGKGGRLLVVWVTQVATLANGEVRRGLYSASLGPGAEEFGSQLLVDPNLKNGTGTSPSVAGAVPGKAIVAYRVITHVFGINTEFTNAVQLRPEDVVAEIRVARLEGDRWSRLGEINRNPAASMRPPSETNGPQVAVGATGRAVVAWQEPESNGVARIWMRRVTGTTLGPVFPASPETFEGQPVTGDATAFALGVTPNDRAKLAARVEGNSGSGGQRVFLTSLGSNAAPSGAKPVGPELADGTGGAAPLGEIGSPAIGVSDGGGTEGSLSLAFTAGSSIRSVGLNPQGALEPPQTVGGAPAAPAGPVVTSVDPEGGTFIGYPTTDESGTPALAVRQEFPSGELQTGFLYGPLGGSISQLVGSGSGFGDELLAFAQGESGQVAIIADRVSAPPEAFGIQVPQKWVKPTKAKIHWHPPETAVGDLTYELVLNGRVVRSGLRRVHLTPPKGLLGSGVSRVRVIATDRLGGEVISRPVKLRVDARPPSLWYQVNSRRGDVVLRLKDAQSGLAGGSVRVSFGDGSRARGQATLHHHYSAPGRYTIRVRARDRVRNLLVQRVQVDVR